MIFFSALSLPFIDHENQVMEVKGGWVRLDDELYNKLGRMRNCGTRQDLQNFREADFFVDLLLCNPQLEIASRYKHGDFPPFTIQLQQSALIPISLSFY